MVRMSSGRTSVGSGDSAPKSLRVYLEQAPDHGSTTDVVTDALREAILEGALPESTWLREDELARDLGVSRTPVRDALRRLSDEHLAERMAHRGTVVAPMRLEDVLAAYAAREVLEGAAARTVANRPQPGTIEELQRIHAAMVEAFEHEDFEQLPKLNLEFHAASGFTARAAETLEEHGAIVQAIIARDDELAAEVAQRHIRNAREARIRRLS
jgi:DNA-binding GntR family transcriptional regulator